MRNPLCPMRRTSGPEGLLTRRAYGYVRLGIVFFMCPQGDVNAQQGMHDAAHQWNGLSSTFQIDWGMNYEFTGAAPEYIAKVQISYGLPDLNGKKSRTV
mmetsp:Transcript_703/g.1284  ORF Transcript_703/g.1284 Transcript_703/m.1284 type:complete len:99 (-) Transcript_703:70-366(-)